MNRTPKNILCNSIMAAVALFFNGLGVYLTIHANIGAGPWDVFHIGLSKTLGILYGNASILVSLSILLIDIVMKEPIGIAMFIDSFVVGKAVDFFTALDAVPVPKTVFGGVGMILVGLVIMGYTQYFYMKAALGCGPRDTLLVGLAKIFRRIPIGAVSIALLSVATLTGWLMGGPVGVGTLVNVFCCGPIMQLAFTTMHFDATSLHHQRLKESWAVLTGGKQ